MGNEVSSARNDAVSVILPDGTVRELEAPLTAAELMLDHPGQAVVEYRGAGAPAPIPADEELEARRIYMMLPMRRGSHNKPTAEEVRRVLACAGSVLRARGDVLSFTGIIPVIAKAVSKGRRRAVAAERRLVVSGKGWRPSLDTIKERSVERKLSHWLF